MPARHAAPRAAGPLKAVGVSRSFQGVQALQDVDLELAPGELVGLIGPNGAGKTTLVNLFTGFDIPSSGRIALGETEITIDVLKKAGMVDGKAPVKILGNGELKSAITVHAHKFSKSAQEKITKAGGKFEVLQ